MNEDPWAMSIDRIEQIVSTIPDEADAAAMLAHLKANWEWMETLGEMVHEAREYCRQAYTDGWFDGCTGYRESVQKVLADPPPLKVPLRPPWERCTKEEMRAELFDVNATDRVGDTA